MKQSYFKNLREHFEKNGNNDWNNRFEYCGERLLSAICFRESANNIYQTTNQPIFTTIGYYYAMFHLSLAVLSLDYKTSSSELRFIQHKKLFHLLEQNIYPNRIVDSQYQDLLMKLNKMRNTVNYSMDRCYKSKIDIHLPTELEKMYEKTGTEFSNVIDFIHCVQLTLDYSWPTMLEMGIGDGFGDDVTSNYLTKNEIETVEAYLLKYNLTT